MAKVYLVVFTTEDGCDVIPCRTKTVARKVVLEEENYSIKNGYAYTAASDGLSLSREGLAIETFHKTIKEEY